MKGYRLKLFISMLVCLFLANDAVSQSDTASGWKLAKDKNGIRIYTRLAEDSKFKEYKSLADIDATPEELLAELLDVGSYTEWMAQVKLAEILETDGEDKFYVYSEVKIPWPFDNRDEITLSEVERPAGSEEIRIKINIIKDFIPEKKGIVRIPSGNGLWIFTPMENGKTRVYHRFAGDPGGTIPAWVVNMFLVDQPYKTMLALQERMLKKKK
jgi:hypothetical protein